MKAAAVQPSFLPWRGFFDIIHRSDSFVFLDDVQFDKRSWRNRNRIKTQNGLQWITVPVDTKGRYSQKIFETEISPDPHWRRKSLNAIRWNYQNAPHFDSYFYPLEKILGREWKYLADLDIYLVEIVMEFLGLRRTLRRSSGMKLASQKIEDKNLRLIRICQELGADRYISGPSARDYIDEALFEKNGIEVEYMNYDYPPYPQLHGGFEPYVSVIDLIFNQGPEAPRFIWNQEPTQSPASP